VNRSIRSRSLYDVTREMRRLALCGRLEEFHADLSESIRAALDVGGRIVFSPDEERYYQEFEMDQVFQDPRTGKMSGVRKLKSIRRDT